MLESHWPLPPTDHGIIAGFCEVGFSMADIVSEIEIVAALGIIAIVGIVVWAGLEARARETDSQKSSRD